MKILLATDGSEHSVLALHAAVDLSAKAGSELHVVHAWRALPPYSHPSVAVATDAEWHEREAEKVLLEQLDEICARGAEAAGAHLRRGQPVERICAVIEELGIDLAILGSRGLGLVERLVMGSVAEGVIDLASCALMVVRGEERAWPPSRVVVGDDSSASAKKAGEFAASIGGLLEAETLLVRAYPVYMDVAEAVRFAEEASLSLHETLHQHGVFLETRAIRLQKDFGCPTRARVRAGEAASVILEAAEEVDTSALIAVGRRELGTLDRLRLGSTSTKVLRAAGGPVLICPS